MLIELSINDAYLTLKPLLFFILGMTAYSVFIFKFYRFLASRDIINLNLFKLNNSNHWILTSFFAIVFYTLEYIILLPLFIFFWFAVLAFLLAFLAKNQPIETILLVAIAVVGAVRIAAFYNTDLSKDLAKMLPFALLGVFLVDITSFSITDTLSLLTDITTMASTLFYYWIFIVILEFILRIMNLIFWKNNTPQKQEE